MWENLWFSKNHKQKTNDMWLKKEFLSYFEELDKVNSFETIENIDDLFGIIILCDQISRNIFRGQN